MRSVWLVVLNVAYLTPVYLLPKLIFWWTGTRGIRHLWGGIASGAAVGGYFAWTGHLLFTRLFVSDLLFHVHLIVSGIVYNALVKVSLMPEVELGQEPFLTASTAVIQVLLYAGVGAVIGLLLDLRK